MKPLNRFQTHDLAPKNCHQSLISNINVRPLCSVTRWIRAKKRWCESSKEILVFVHYLRRTIIKTPKSRE